MTSRHGITDLDLKRIEIMNVEKIFFKIFLIVSK